MKNAIKNYLMDNMEVVGELVSEINSWNDDLEFLQVYDMDYIDLYLEGCEPSEILNKMFYGDFNPNHSYFRLDAYANLESLDAYDLEDEYRTYIDEIIDALLNADIEIYDNGLKEIMEAYEE